MADWSPDEAKRLFVEQRPAVSKDVAIRLWRYWDHRGPDAALFDDPEQDVALLLHARAYGARVPDPGDAGYCGALLADRSELFAPLMPNRVPWGPRAVLADEVRCALDSPIMDAWVFKDGPTLRQVLIVGEGLPEVRQHVMPAAFFTSLSAGGEPTDCVNVGVVRIQAVDGAAADPLLPFPFVGLRGAPLRGDAADAARAALDELVLLLRRFERETGLVQVTEAALESQQDVARALRSHAAKASTGPALLWAPAQAEELVGTVPYHRIAQRDGGVLALELSAELLATQSFGNLLDEYRYATIERVRIDALVRRDHHWRASQQITREQRDYARSKRAGDLRDYDETVLLTHRHDGELGIDIRLAEPEEVSTERYYEDVVPGLVESHQRWFRRMDQIVASIAAAADRRDNPVLGLAAARFLDAAVRDREPDDSPASTAAFARWAKEAAPMLRFEWRSFLRKAQIDPGDVMTPHTFFHARQITAAEGQDRLAMSPLTIVDRMRSVVLLDARRRVVVVRDPTDDAQPAQRTADADWVNLVASARQAGRSIDEFAHAFAESLRAAPAEVVERTLETLSERPEDAQAELDELTRQLAGAFARTALPRALTRASAGLSVGAFQTARGCLAALFEDEEHAVRAALFGAIVECLVAGRDVTELSAVARGDAIGSTEIDDCLERARQLDRAYAGAWLDDVEELGLNRSARRLFLGLPPERERCDRGQLAALESRRAAESARLARRLEQAAATLSDQGEPQDGAFIKLGGALDELVLAEFAGGLRDEAWELLAVTTGREPPRYGGRLS